MGTHAISTMVLFSLITCRNVPPTAILTGRIEDAKSKFVVLSKSSERYAHNQWLTAIDTFELHADGTFYFKFPIRESDFYQISDLTGRPQTPDLYLAPGDSLSVVMRTVEKRIEYAYEGSRAGAYKYIALRDSLHNASPLFTGNYRDVYYLTEDSAATLLGKRLQWEMQLIDTFFQENTDWQPIRQYVTDQRRYENAAQCFSYLYYHNYYTKDTFTYHLPDTGYYRFLKGIDLSYCPKPYLGEYFDFITKYVEDRMEQRYPDMPDSLRWEQDLMLRFETIKAELSGEAHDAALFALTRMFSQLLSKDDFFEKLQGIEEYFEKHVTADHFLRKYHGAAESFKALKPGMPAPDIVLPGLSGDTIGISELQGKIVYLDFWGTWCFPCLQELPNSLALHEKFKDDPVEFVFVGLQSGENQITEWREFITGQRSFSYAPFLEQRMYPGVHMLSEGQFGNPQIQDYKINFAPTYVLIDAAGNLVSARAPRPSDEKLEAMIRDVLATIE